MPPKQQEVKIRKSKNPITGAINITGEPDSGKSWFALSSGAAPERTAFIDDDVKGEAIVNEVESMGRKFGYYRNLIKEGKDSNGNNLRELEFHKLCISILDDIEPGKYDVLVWDTWKRFENTFHPVVVANPSKYKQFYSPMGQIKGAEQWNASFEYEAAVISAMTEIVPLVILTSHLKKDASKREVAEAKRPLIEKCRMRVFLRHSSDTPEPTGLMLKRLSKAEVGDYGMRPINVTHRKVHPFTWERLIWYWNNPVGNTKPSPEEELNEFELSILDGILTKDQKDVLAMARIDAEREREEEERNLKARNRILRKNGSKDEEPTTPITLLTKAMSEYGMDSEKVMEILGLGDVDEIMSMGRGEVQDAWEKIRTSE
jgi:hypothetical protein